MRKTAKDNSCVNLDDVDKEILILLQENGRIPISEIAKKVGRSQTAVRARLAKLNRNLIEGYIAIIDCCKIGYNEMVLIFLRPKSNVSFDEIKEKIAMMREIKYSYIVTGEYPIFLMAKCISHEDAIRLINKLRENKNIEDIKTQMVLERVKEDHTIIIPES
ncbi:MAG: Lrp/AsnC family transcriptional regulator [Promethearchaeota archaeon]